MVLANVDSTVRFRYPLSMGIRARRAHDLVPDAYRLSFPRFPSLLACALAQRLPLLARLGLRDWRADLFGAAWAIVTIGGLTFASGVVVAVAMNERSVSRQ
jgi:hypothetical protein